jgi:HKD family nuclease
MKLLTSPESLLEEISRLSQQYRYFDWAVAWATADHDAFDCLKKHQSKIRRIIVGTHFHQTAPSFIDAFAKIPEVRYRIDQEGLNGVFHPKLYLFSNSATEWESIVGSPNFTTGAFTRNVEHAILIGAGDTGDGITQAEIVNEIDRLWQKGRHFSPTELAAYRLRWQRNKKLLDRAAGHDGGQKRRESIYDRKLLSFSWDEYLQELRSKKEKYFADRLTVLREAGRIWSAEPSFAKLSSDDRKKVAGTASEKVIRWRLFGSMRGAFKFTKALSENNPELLTALDAIPLTGALNSDHFHAYIHRLSRAFVQTKEFGALGVATRLLCLRRPDYFVCVDKKNKAGLFRMLGVQPGDVTVHSYWDTVVAPLIDTPWWQSPRPVKNPDAQTIWDGRVAMIDALFYEGHG